MGRSCPWVKKKKVGRQKVDFDLTWANLLTHTWFCVFNRNHSRKCIIIVDDEVGVCGAGDKLMRPVKIYDGKYERFSMIYD